MIVNDKIYGPFEIKDPLLIKIMNTKAMQRLKGICQYSTLSFIYPEFNTTRFEHCLGTYYLLKKFVYTLRGYSFHHLTSV